MPRSPKSSKPSKPDQAPRKRTAPPTPPAGSADQPAGPPQAVGKKEDGKKAPPRRIEIPLISTPNDQAEIEREMEELFNEEKVTHRHGGTEPERD